MYFGPCLRSIIVGLIEFPALNLDPRMGTAENHVTFSGERTHPRNSFSKKTICFAKVVGQDYIILIGLFVALPILLKRRLVSDAKPKSILSFYLRSETSRHRRYFLLVSL